MTYDQGFLDSIENGAAAFVLGAGVAAASTNASPTSTWTGLLAHGTEFAMAHNSMLEPAWRDLVHMNIKVATDTNDADTLLTAAQLIGSKLGAPDGALYKQWLAEAIGSLKVQDATLISAIAAFELAVATTNYDTLFESVSPAGVRQPGLRPKTCSSPPSARL